MEINLKPWRRPEVGGLEVGGLVPEVGGLVHPDDKRVPVGDENPLADVELGVVDQQRALYVLLHHIPGPLVLKFWGIIY